MSELSTRAKAYLFAIYACGAAILLWQLTRMRVEQPLMLLALCIAGSLASIFKVEGATNRSHYTINFLVYGFTFAALGVPEALVVIAISNLVEWLWRRPPWYIQLFNTACYVIITYLAGLVYVAINPSLETTTIFAIAGIVAAMATFTFLNHLLVGIVVWLARGEDFHESGVFDILPLIMDMTLLSLGASMVIVWNQNPYALILYCLPLYLIYSTLRVPALERQTETDSKTGLFNHGYFMEQVENELRRASRFDRPMTIIMADLDLLRNINNTYGHLAGDEVLIKIAALFKEAVREYDVVARFGGEEFAVLMPETTAQQAFERGETIRHTIEQTPFVISTSVTPINVTVSMGIAGRERFNQPANEIIHNADTALYHSKLRGRNRTYVCANETYETFLPELGHGIVHPSAPAEEPSAPETQPVVEPAYAAAQASLVRPEQPTPNAAGSRRADAAGTPPAAVERDGSAIKVNLFIGLVLVGSLLSLAAVTAIWPIHLNTYSPLDWLSLALFASIVALTEWFSVELYVKHTTVSTSAVPMLAGTLLFGPIGAVVLSGTFAITALIKYRSPISRLFFNFGNQLFAAMLYTGAIALGGSPFISLNLFVQCVVCLAASLIVYLATTALVATGVSIDLNQNMGQVWKEQYGWLATSYAGMGLASYALIFGYSNNHIMGVLVMVLPLALLRYSQQQYVDRTRTMVNELHEKQRTLERTAAEIRALNNGLLDTLAEVIDLGDPYVLGHSMRVAQFATSIAGRLGLPEKQIELIRNASLLHDIGKLGISAQLLGKPSKLTLEEYEIVKKHVVMGTELLEKSRSLKPLAPIIGCHHEHFDGKGYPNKLAGRDIPLESRIIAASDAIETMASDRPYRKHLPLPRIIDELQRCSGSQFDPLVVEAAVTMLRETIEDVAVDSPRPLTVPAARLTEPQS
ncbi:MAG TPA: diguanylate cyclase [Anaerolineales bacterium]|nr:diguanylate cyclase [Anaerolineales bacterium]